MKIRAGYLRKNLSGEQEYFSFVPSALPPVPKINSSGMLELLTKANSNLAVLNDRITSMPNADIFIPMFIRKESLLSSQIEGIQATLEDVLNPMQDSIMNCDVSDAVNHIKASEYSIDRLNTLPLCNRLIRETHAVLLSGERGYDKSPGEFRYTQNWIGAPGSTLKTARYVPPCPEDMYAAMFELEKFINDNDDMDPLVKAALMHYQFETIHPFLDGNGRVGRLMITLYFLENKVLKAPVLYISYFLKKNRIEYYDRMSEVRRTGDYEQWVRFFLEAIIESSEDAIDTIGKLVSLHEANIDRLMNSGRSSADNLKLFGYLERNPIIEIGKTAEELGLSFATASNTVKRLEAMEILVRSNESKRNRVYSYEPYLEILRSGTL